MRLAALHGFLQQNRGAERAFLNMMVSLRKRGHDIDIFAFAISGEFEKALRASGIGVHSMHFRDWKIGGSRLNGLRRIYPLRSYFRMARQVNQGNYDAVFVHHLSCSVLLPLLKGATCYYCQEPLRWFYEPDVSGEPLRMFANRIVLFPYKCMDRYSVARADLVLANSDYSREYIWKVYGCFARTNYLGVDIEKFRKIAASKGDFILSVGVIYPLKAHDFIIRSLAQINQSIRPKLVLVGNGSERSKQALLDLAARFGVALEMKSDVSDDELVGLYNQARVTALAYIMEPFGLTALESMACGTPVVAVREGGLRESVTPDTGILTARDEREFGRAVEHLLRNPETAGEMGRRGRARVEKHFTWERCAEELEANLLSLVGKHG